jgi:DNA-binding CsgD family transcriptional regulator
VPAGRCAQLQLLAGVVRLLIARERADLPAVAGEAERLRDVADAPDAAPAGLGGELRALALISLGSTEVWTTRLEDAERHLDQGVALAHRIGRPYLELTGLAYRTTTEIYRSSLVRAAERSRQAAELAEQHGWTEEPAAGAACGMLGAVLAWQGRAAEAEPWVQRAERTIRAEADSGTASMVVHDARGVLELARGRDAGALAAFAATERLAGHLAASHMLVPPTRALRLVTLVRLGQIQRARHDLAELRGKTANAARYASPQPGCGSRSTTRTRPPPRSRRSWTAPLPCTGHSGWLRPAPPPGGPRPPLEPLSDSEIRVLRYLPTNLSTPEIANELYVTANTVRTHVRHLYAKLGTHSRAETVEHARALGLLARSAHRR